MAKRTNKKPMAHSSAFRLVGEFLFNWNLLEGGLNEAITKLCKLDPLHGAIITANLHFQTKMTIFATLVDLLGKGKSEAWKQSANGTISTISGINSQWRNLVVHCPGRPVDNNTLKFLRVSARRSLKFPDERRNKQQFQQVYASMQTCWKEIDRIAEDLSSVTNNALAKALLAAPPFVVGSPILGFPPLVTYPPTVAVGNPFVPGPTPGGGLFGGGSIGKGSK